MWYVIFDNYEAFLFDRPGQLLCWCPMGVGKIIDIPNGV